MLDETLNQSLIELEESLRAIQSAREQVTNVAEKSERLTRTYTDLLRTLKNVEEVLSVESGGFREGLDNSATKLNRELQQITTEVSTKSEGIKKELEEVLLIFSERVSALKLEMVNLSEEIQATEQRMKELDLKKDLLEEIHTTLSEHTEALQTRLSEIENTLAGKTSLNLAVIIIGFIVLALISIFT